jgi:hypothetical protein
LSPTPVNPVQPPSKPEGVVPILQDGSCPAGYYLTTGVCVIIDKSERGPVQYLTHDPLPDGSCPQRYQKSGTICFK